MTLISDRGFTLIEVLVAMAITGIVLGLVISLFGGGVRATQATRGYSRALLLAKDKLDEGLNEAGYVTGEGDDTGSVMGFEWKRTVGLYHLDGDDGSDYTGGLYRVDVRVGWNDGIRTREVALHSLVSGRQALR
jgi:prepilin-type N-terminal cleavage/methylation domain-containing protein